MAENFGIGPGPHELKIGSRWFSVTRFDYNGA